MNKGVRMKGPFELSYKRPVQDGDDQTHATGSEKREKPATVQTGLHATIMLSGHLFHFEMTVPELCKRSFHTGK